MFEEEIICESCDNEFTIHYYSEMATINFCPFCGNKIDTFDVDEMYENFAEDDD